MHIYSGVIILTDSSTRSAVAVPCCVGCLYDDGSIRAGDVVLAQLSLQMAEESFWCNDDEGNLHQLKWDRSLAKITKNKNGSTGFARVVSSDSLDGDVRIHLCSQQPCAARWGYGEYGNQGHGPPMHMQPFVSPPAPPPAAAVSGVTASAASAEPAIAAQQAPAVAGPGAEPPEASPPDVVAPPSRPQLSGSRGAWAR